MENLQKKYKKVTIRLDKNDVFDSTALIQPVELVGKIIYTYFSRFTNDYFKICYSLFRNDVLLRILKLMNIF